MKIRGAALVAVAALTLAGCGGSDDTGGAGGATDPAASGPVSAKKLLVEFSECDTGTIEDTAKMTGFRGAICNGFDGEQAFKIESHDDPAAVSGNSDYLFGDRIEVFVLGDDSEGILSDDVKAAAKKTGYTVTVVDS